MIFDRPTEIGDPQVGLSQQAIQRLYKNRYLNAVDQAAENLGALSRCRMQEYEAGSENRRYGKYLICLHEEKLSDALAILAELHKERKAIITCEPELATHRTLAAPVLLINTLYARLSTHTAVSVGKLDDGILEHLEMKILKYAPDNERQEQLDVLASLEALHNDKSVRYRRVSGVSYQLYAYDDSAERFQRRLNLNNMVVLVGAKGYDIPAIEYQRPRKRRCDADQRQVIACLHDLTFYRVYL